MAFDLLVNSKVKRELFLQQPGPDQDPCEHPLVILLYIVKFLVVITTVLLLKNSLLSLYKLLGQLKSLKPFSIPGHHAESMAPWTSRLVIITRLQFSSTGSMNDFASIVASIVLLCGVHPNSLSVSSSFLKVIIYSVNK